jgi:hypothetical protein
MGKPVSFQSLDAASSATTGESTQSLGHYHPTLLVVAENLDPANDTLQVDLEGAPGGKQAWAFAGGVQADKHIDASDFSQDPTSGNMTASVTLTGTYFPHLRARIKSFTDDANGDLSVDAYILASAWPETGVRGGRVNK